MRYTVQLLYPDYATGDFGRDFFMDDIDVDVEPDEAYTTTAALTAAAAVQERFYRMNGEELCLQDPVDMAVLAVLAVADGEIVCLADSADT